MARKSARREDHRESGSCIGKVTDHSVDDRVGPCYERLLYQADLRIVEYPHTKIFVGSDNVDLVHDFPYPRLNLATRVVTRKWALPHCKGIASHNTEHG